MKETYICNFENEFILELRFIRELPSERVVMYWKWRPTRPTYEQLLTFLAGYKQFILASSQDASIKFNEEISVILPTAIKGKSEAFVVNSGKIKKL